MINGMVQMIAMITAAVGRLTFPQPALCKGLYLLRVVALYIFWRCKLHRAQEPRAATLIFAFSGLNRPKSSPTSSEGEQAVADGRKSKYAFDHALCAFAALHGAPSRFTGRKNRELPRSYSRFLD